MGRIPSRTLLHGAALLELIPEDKPVTVEQTGGGYIVNQKIGIWLKTTTGSLPAQFTFVADEILRMTQLRRLVDSMHIGLVCPTEGVCALEWEQFTAMVVVEAGAPAKTLMVRKPLDGGFRVKGTDRDRPLIVPIRRWSAGLLAL